jgi:molybdopterin/thiamine biosynthesis adenylyltransferase
MKEAAFIVSLRPERHACRDLRGVRRGLECVTARHEGVPGFDQERLTQASILLVGAGGINGEIGEGLVRKGIGELHLLDGDTVALSNLNRQHFKSSDLGMNKALRLARHLAKEGYMGTSIHAIPFYFQEALEREVPLRASIVVCGVDNDECRVAVAQYAYDRGIPAVFIAVSRDANHGYVFIQRPDAACFVCLHPEAFNNEEHPCPGVPAVKDVLKLVAGLSLYAIDTLIMDRKRNWNYRLIHLAGFMPDSRSWVQRIPSCLVCGGHSSDNVG